jgi:hypothetical protein
MHIFFGFYPLINKQMKKENKDLDLSKRKKKELKEIMTKLN